MYPRKLPPRCRGPVASTVGFNSDLPEQLSLFVHPQWVLVISAARAPVLVPTCIGQVESEQFFIELHTADLVEFVDLED